MRWIRSKMEDISLSHPENTSKFGKIFLLNCLYFSFKTLSLIHYYYFFNSSVFFQFFCCGFSVMKEIFKVACLGEAMALFKNFLLVVSRPLLQELSRNVITKHQTEILLYLQTRWNTENNMAYIVNRCTRDDQGCVLFKVIFHFSSILMQGSLRATYHSRDVKKSWKGGEYVRGLYWVMNHCLAIGEGLFHLLLYDCFISCMLHECDGLTTLSFCG